MKAPSSLICVAVFAALASTLITLVDARPMHADMEPHYQRYLQQKEAIQSELDKWMSKFKDQAEENGLIPASEARSAEDADEDRRQRFFLTKEKIKTLEKQNPDAKFSTDSPFTLLTDEEFHAYVHEAYRKVGGGRRLRGGDSWDDEPEETSFEDRANEDNDKNDDDVTFLTATTPTPSRAPVKPVTRAPSATTTRAPVKPVTRSPTAPVKPVTRSPTAPVKPITRAPTAPTTRAPVKPVTRAPTAPVTRAPVKPATRAPTATPPPPVKPVTRSPTAPTTRAPAVTSRAPVTNAPTTGPVAPINPNTPASSAVIVNGVDWSTTPCVAKPGNQGQCGSCWAFATVGAVEAGQCIAAGKKGVAKYSEQQLVSCDTKNGNCKGGAPPYAFNYIQTNGLCTESAYPYSSANGVPGTCVTTCKKTQTGLKGYTRVGRTDADLVAALKIRPVVVAVTAGNDVWKQYAGGLIKTCGPVKLDHAVLAVGYDADSIKIKNSWGERWGEAGYMRLQRTTGTGTCGVHLDITSPTF